MNGYKFNIGDNPELSKKVQGILFGLGYAWVNSGKKCRHTNETALYAYPDGDITYGDNGANFKDCGREEVDVSWLLPREEPIKVDGNDCKFNDDGSVKVGCTNVDFKTIEAIYNKARETAGK